MNERLETNLTKIISRLESEKADWCGSNIKDRNAKTRTSRQATMRKKPGSYKRCTDELKESVRVKRAETFRRSEQDLQKLVREGKAVNFSAVARSAKVSIAWLYKEPEVRRRIEHPRGQMQPQKVVIPSPERISEASLRAQNNALKKRDQELTHEIKLLNERISFAFGIIASNNLPIPD